MSSSVPATDFRTIQALRALAALQVVAFHAIEMWTQRLGGNQAWQWRSGAAGVDVFFVVSGFVMAVSASRLPAGAWWRFLRRRLLRIVPLYWLMTALKVAAVWAAPALALHTRLGAGGIAASLLFWPVRDGAGQFRPVLPVGWTLDFEMLFYGLFAVALALRVRPLLLLAPVLALLACVPHGQSAGWLLCDPIVLEFGFGVAIGGAWLRGRGLSFFHAAVLGSCGVAALVLAPPGLLPSGWAWARLLRWGLPAAAIVAAAVSLEVRLGPHVPRSLLRLGDASYAVYLSHGFALAALASVLPRLGVPLVPVLVAGLALAAVLGVAVHEAVERRLLDVLNGPWAGARRLHA